jgi:16S rRNA G1207 methylase RsmC
MEESEHYYHAKTGIPIRLGKVTAFIRGHEFEFYTSPPVFSWRKVDRGTITLAENLVVPEGAKTLLDVGSGYGVIGITAAYFNPHLKVTMVDVSKRATMLAKKNVAAYMLSLQCEVLRGSVYEPAGYHKFDIIASNPPYSAGKEVVNEIIHGAPAHLNHGGLLQIVGRHQKGGKMYRSEMEEVFEDIEEYGRSGGFRVYVGRNPITSYESMVMEQGRRETAEA